jgi:DNA-binding IscR family transcriptional regulator
VCLQKLIHLKSIKIFNIRKAIQENSLKSIYKQSKNRDYRTKIIDKHSKMANILLKYQQVLQKLTVTVIALSTHRNRGQCYEQYF